MQGKAKKFKGMMSLNECFIVLTASSRKGNFLLAGKKQKTKQCFAAALY